MTTAVTADDFLADVDAEEITWTRPAGAPVALTPVRVTLGRGADPLEVAFATAGTAPKMDDVRRLWSLRWNRRATPVLLVVAHQADGGWVATVCGPGENPAAVAGLDLGQVERICAAALVEPDAGSAKRTLGRLLAGPTDQLIAGLTNQGLFASHELREGVPARPDWTAATERASVLLGMSGADLIAALGYNASAHGTLAQVLSAATPGEDSPRRAVAVLLREGEVFDRPGTRFGSVSPVTQGLAIAQEQGLPWLIVARGTQWRLYPAKPDVGVGRKGQSETYVELDLALLTASDAGYLTMLFAADALAEGGPVSQILAASVDHVSALGARLRERVYDEVVPVLAVAVGNHMREHKGSDLTEQDLHEAYHRTLIILFRLLFVAYAEDRGLLPYQRNPRYTRKALKTLAREFTDTPDLSFDDEATDRWEDLLAVWRAVDDGNREWDVPAYNGGLFAADPDLHPAGHAITEMRLTNAQIGPVLKALLIDASDDGDLGPVDFRSLSVREFGTIYEGLLESSLSVAPTDLTIDSKSGAYLPAGRGTPIQVAAGEIYFHNASGARKSTGSYFTKAFAVEHLLDSALEPTLDEHLAAVAGLLDAGDEAGAAEKFFDFRVADIAMGSGHFLVAAIDRIESRMSRFIADRPVPAVTDELARLAAAAHAALGEGADRVEIEPSALLRRQVARRCIYGLDLNLMAVELARLAIWIHTFVPGLPMSSLGHGLRTGNSLTGIGSVAEALDVLEPKRPGGQASLFADQIVSALDSAQQRLQRLARTAEATKSEVHQATREHQAAMRDAADAKAFLDAAVVIRLGEAPLPAGPEGALSIGRDPVTSARIEVLGCAHLPYLFPEVFGRANPGFDVVLGNPPWEKIKVEEHGWWGLRFPGLRSMEAKAREAALLRHRAERPDLVAEYEADVESAAAMRTVIKKGPFPGIGSGDTDVYKAFCWRDWQLIRDGGRAGIVFPRGAFSGTGTTRWRQEILAHGAFESITFLANTRRWVFDEVHPQYTVGLATIRKGGKPGVAFDGPYHSMADLARGAEAVEVSADEFASWSSSASFPLLPSAGSAGVFQKMRRQPRFDDATHPFAFRPVAELHATGDKKLMSFDLDQPTGTPVYTGASFNLWTPEAGPPYAYSDTETLLAHLHRKRQRQARTSSSAFYGMDAEDPATLPILQPRIAFRDVARATDSRTTIAALIPPGATCTHKAPYLLQRRGDDQDTAYLLGILSSTPFDWCARRYVEITMSFEVLNALPIPAADSSNPLRRRVVEISGRLAAVDGRYNDWASAVGVPVGSVTDEDTKTDLIAELDAVVALLYGLDVDDVTHIFETFHRGWRYQEPLAAAMSHLDAWKTRGGDR